MREQVKGRMEVLLEQEIQSRQLSSTTTNSAKPVSRTSQTGLSGSTTSRTGSSVGSATRGVSEVGEEGGRESTKADLVFNVDSGTYCVCVCVDVMVSIHIISVAERVPKISSLIVCLYINTHCITL